MKLSSVAENGKTSNLDLFPVLLFQEGSETQSRGVKS